MRLVEILSEDRVVVARSVADKPAALQTIARLLARGAGVTEGVVRGVLEEREALQSTGIGEGVAIPHGFLGDLGVQVAALIVVPEGVAFDAIDGRPARIILGVVGPKKGMHAQVEHLRILARVSKVLREPGLREKLVTASDSTSVFQLIRDADSRAP
jgi:PTS system nitrogen regulatory IIA component